MSKALFKPEEFEPLIPCIQEATRHPGERLWLKMAIPNNLQIDDDKVRQYFASDAVLRMQRVDGIFCTILTGSILNEELAGYISARAFAHHKQANQFGL